jgi:hypothetical protein
MLITVFTLMLSTNNFYNYDIVLITVFTLAFIENFYSYAIMLVSDMLGVDGLDVVIGTSSILRQFSHGKDMTYITEKAIEVVNFIKSKGLEVRFSSEDSFRSDLVDLLSIYRTMDRVCSFTCN